MTLYTVRRSSEDVTDREYGAVTVGGNKYHVFRTSPLFGDWGYGAVTIHGQTHMVYRAKRKDGDIGYGVINIEKKSKKKPVKNDTKKLPDDLAAIIRLWPGLSERIKSKIEALVQTHSKEAI